MPPGYENVTAEQAKLSGMFPLPGAPRAQMDAQKLQAFINQPSNADKSALKPQTARQAKRLFLNNLPATATDQSVANWFNLHLNGLNVVVTNDSCISVNISVDRGFALVEFKAPEDTTMALALDGETMEEHMAEANGDAMNGQVSGLQISRPKDYIVPTPEADQYNTNGENGISTVVPDSKGKISVSHIPPYLEEAQVIELVQAFGELKAFTLVKDNTTDESRGIAFLEYANPDSNPIAVEGLNGMEIGDQHLKTSMASIGIAQAPAEMGVSAMTMLAGTEASATEGSRVVQLLNMVTPEELIDNDDYEEICEDIMEECQKYGKITEMKIPRPAGGSRQSNGVGKIFLKYADTSSAKTALQSLAGRKFADRTVVSTYFDEASFEVNAW
ncbi:hypothetical protein LTR66_016066 [Elasticomyces elasticus]|nr:hypothetical protein LTR66_016066 [Elasticomyces elasticus]